MNDEVENYKNDEFVSILGAFPDRTKILINGSGHAPHGACKWGRRGAILHKIVITENRR